MEVAVIDNILEDWLFEDLLKEFKKDKKYFKTEDRGDLAKYERWYPERKSKISKISESCIFSEKVKKHVNDFKDLSWRMLLSDMPVNFEVQVTKYPSDATLGYDWHTDHITPMRRILNWILYIEDNFEGGELLISEKLIRGTPGRNVEFPIGQSIKPKKNRLVMMPSWMIHKIKPVTSGLPRVTINGHIS